MRIISGKYKSRKLIPPLTNATRPTSDRARESIFNIISNLKPDFMNGAIVLDAFAGSGALGLEALSRGASHIIFMEKNHQTAQIIRKNVNNFMAESQCIIIVGDATKPPKANQPMTLIFLDPPYDQIVEDICLEALFKLGWINEETLIILETSIKREIKIPSFAKVIDQRRYGAAMVSLIMMQ